MSNTIERFSNRVENYVKYRPGYPPRLLELFRAEMNLTENAVVADIGSGTGISAKVFLENGNVVCGVEPNRAMRLAAEEFLRDFPRFRSVDGTAENTGLPDAAVDFVTAAQAFHWFDRTRTAAEFRRILRPGGHVALIWNERELDSNDFLREYENFLKKYGTDYEKVRHDKLERAVFEQSFQAPFSHATFPNAQTVDFEGLKGRALSSSYMPAEPDAAFAPMVADLETLFAKYAENGKIQILYSTNVFYTRL